MRPLNMTARRLEALSRLAEAGVQDSAATDLLAGGAAGAAAAAADPAAAIIAEGLSEAMPPGGDGFAFVMRSAVPAKRGRKGDAAVGPTAVGRPGSGLGYAGLPGPGLAIEFDTRMDLAERDPNGNHVSVHVQTQVGGALLSSYESDDARIASLPYAQLSLRRPRIVVTASASAAGAGAGGGQAGSGPVPQRPPGSKSNKALVAQISYQPQLRSLKVFVEDLVSPVLVVSGVPPLAGSFLVGFTASSSGESADTHEICQWYFEKQRTRRSVNKDAEAADGGGGGGGVGEISAAAAAAKLALVADPKPKVQEACDEGFTGESCMLDVASAEKTCLFATRSGCSGCISHAGGHCVWCQSQSRCISSEMATRTFDTRAHAPYCSNPASIVEELEQCVEPPGYLVWVAGGAVFAGAGWAVVALTGSIWARSKRDGTLLQDAAALLFYTISKSQATRCCGCCCYCCRPHVNPLFVCFSSRRSQFISLPVSARPSSLRR
jgi:hypothetical protein